MRLERLGEALEPETGGPSVASNVFEHLRGPDAFSKCWPCPHGASSLAAES